MRGDFLRKLTRKEEKVRKQRERKLRELILNYVLDYTDIPKEALNGTKRDSCLTFCWSLYSFSYEDIIEHWKKERKQSEK